jgi:hypothetical protein
MREKIEKKLAAIRKSIGERGISDGTEIATKEEMRWLVEQAAKDGILLHVSEDPGTWQQGDECYYYYTAMSVKMSKERVRQFVDTYSLITVGALNRLLYQANEPRVEENIKQILRLIQARDRRRRARRRKEEQEMAEMEELNRIEAEREEAADHRNDLDWLVSRIESLGWEVTLRKKKPTCHDCPHWQDGDEGPQCEYPDSPPCNE